MITSSILRTGARALLAQALEAEVSNQAVRPVQAPPDIIRGVAIDLKSVHLVSDDETDEELVLLDETQNDIAEALLRG